MTKMTEPPGGRLAAARKEQTRLDREAEAATAAAEQWGQRAMSAVRAGDDVVARDAFVRRSECEKKAAELRAARDEQGAEVERLTAGPPRAEADLQLLRKLAKAPALTAAKPLAKTTGARDADASRARVSRERRTKR
jgi:phage shock protein A